MKRVILSGGGTGGHIYPAVAVGEALKAKYGDQVDLLFVGAEGKMEMEKIPALGYKIEGLPTAGLQRRLALSNLSLPMKVVRSIKKAHGIVAAFKPDVVVGFGGYASAPIIWTAQQMGIPTIIQEQNSYAGLTNKIVGRRAKKVCVAYENMERFFDPKKIVTTGNPLRGRFADRADKAEALRHFGLDASRQVVLVVGGSLGSGTMNAMMSRWLNEQQGVAPFQVIWQTGRYYYEAMRKRLEAHPVEGVWQGAFIDRMDYAYTAADLVVSRSGACSVSELCVVGKPTLFIPSPNVTEDHQTKNAAALCSKGAARMIADSEAVAEGMHLVANMLADKEALAALADNISRLAITDSAERVVSEIEKLW